MAWLYVPGLEDSSSELSESLMNTKPFVMLRGKPSAPQSLRNKWKKGGFIRLLSGLTFEPSTASLGVESWIASLRDSHANHSARQESKKEQKTPGIFGLRSPELLAKFDPQSSSWKTFQASLFTPGRVSLETWPKWGIIKDGVLFEHQTPQHLIDVRDGSALRSIPTPTTMDSAFHGSVRTQALEAWKRDPESTRGVSLPVYAKRFPTPTAREAKDIGLNIKKQRKDGRHRLDLFGRQISHQEGLSKVGRLNPEWVEWLMGWPIGWTDLERVETELSRNRQS